MSNEINNNNNYESKYIQTLLQINKSLRNELEVIYKLLRQKLKLESTSSLSTYNSNNISKLNNLMNEFEIILSNLGIQMESHNELISALKTIEEKYSTIQKNTILLNNMNELQKKLKILLTQNNEFKLKFENMKKTTEFLNKENIDLRLQLERNLKEKKEMSNIISQIENMGDKLKEMEKKYKDKLWQKDDIISQLDEQLQQYELKIKQLQKELLLSKIEVEKNKVEIMKEKSQNNLENNSTNLNTNNSTVYLNSNMKLLNSIINNGLSLSSSMRNKKLDENKKNDNEEFNVNINNIKEKSNIINKEDKNGNLLFLMDRQHNNNIKGEGRINEKIYEKTNNDNIIFKTFKDQIFKDKIVNGLKKKYQFYEDKNDTELKVPLITYQNFNFYRGYSFSDKNRKPIHQKLFFQYINKHKLKEKEDLENE